MESRPGILWLLGVILVFTLVAAVPTYFGFFGNRASPHRACMSNLKQMGTGMQIYLADYDNRLPPKNWHDELLSYAKNDDLFTCPQLAKYKKKWGYAFNMDFLGADTAKIANPDKSIMLFETDALAQDVVANTAAMTPRRHEYGSNVCRIDSSVKRVRDPALGAP